MVVQIRVTGTRIPSMKVPPKRKGNLLASFQQHTVKQPLNESPSEKEGK